MIKRRGTPRLTSKPHWLLCCQQGCRDGAVVAHPTSNQGDAGSIPTHGTDMFFHSKKKDQLVVRCRYLFTQIT